MKRPTPSSKPLYTIGVAADLLDLSVHSLRQYEREGLILPYKTPSGRRLYSDLELEKVRCIRRMIHEKGLNFAGIRHLMALVPCYSLRDCPVESRKRCVMMQDRSAPCWFQPGTCAIPFPSCRECPVYTNIVSCRDIQLLVSPGKRD
jgi:MerR family transcriptional regulator/heat shock protein HspR